MRFEIVTQYVEFVREIVSEEFRLSLLVDVGLQAEAVIGRIDFKDGPTERARPDRRGDRGVGTRSEGVPDRPHPKPAVVLCGGSPGPDRLKFGEFKRECLARFRHDGSISHVVEDAKTDGSAISPWDMTVD